MDPCCQDRDRDLPDCSHLCKIESGSKDPANVVVSFIGVEGISKTNYMTSSWKFKL